MIDWTREEKHEGSEVVRERERERERERVIFISSNERLCRV